MNVPVISVMGIESLSVIGSPLIKGYPIFSLISISKISLAFPFWSPAVTIFIPWSVISGFSPWVSHFNDFLNAFSIGGKAESLKDTISVTSNNVVVTDLSSSGHWVFVLGTFGNNCPEFVIGHCVGVMLRDWHTSECSERFTWSTGINLGVINVEFRESLLKED